MWYNNGYKIKGVIMDGMENIGYLGTACFIISYGLVQSGRMDGNGFWYTVTNAAGCVFMILSLFSGWNMPVFLNNAFSLVLSFIGFWRHYQAKKLVSLSNAKEVVYSDEK
jgi:hypothetical protein